MCWREGSRLDCIRSSFSSSVSLSCRCFEGTLTVMGRFFEQIALQYQVVLLARKNNKKQEGDMSHYVCPMLRNNLTHESISKNRCLINLNQVRYVPVGTSFRFILFPLFSPTTPLFPRRRLTFVSWFSFVKSMLGLDGVSSTLPKSHTKQDADDNCD